jgi:hypothetical protein
MSGQLCVLTVLSPEERAPGINCIGSWLSTTAGFEAVANRKTSSPLETELRFSGRPARSLGTALTQLPRLLHK